MAFLYPKWLLNLEFVIMWLEKKEDKKIFTEVKTKASWTRKVGRFLKKFLIFFLVLVLLVGLIAAIFSLIYYRDLANIYAEAESGRERLIRGKDLLLEKNFSTSVDQLQVAEDNFIEAQNELARFNFLKPLPLIGSQVADVADLFEAVINLARGTRQIALFGQDLSSTIDFSRNFNQFTSAQKETLLRRISEAEPLFLSVKADIEKSQALLNQISTSGLLSPFKTSVGPLKEQLLVLDNLLDQSLPLLKVLPPIFGFPEEKTYLFLLENNSELRPTGGFIGTYGILKLKDGEITYFRTDNVYNLDGPAEKFLKIPLPAPLQKYLGIKYWFLRDANWSPDFPASAKQALDLYRLEGGKESQISGVIAVTPALISRLLELTGSIQVQEINFTSDNLTDTLENLVEKGYYRRGIKESERKEIIGQLANEIKSRLFSLSLNQWPKLIDVVKSDLDQKQILLYSAEANLENLILVRNWGGALRPTSGDYVSVVDANVGALKSDQEVERRINYQIRSAPGQLVARVAITYLHRGQFTWKTTRLRTYSRVYVPAGSKLIRGEGMLENDKLFEPSGKPGQVEVGEEEGKTYFGAFISIEPGEELTLSFEYLLPSSIADQINQGSYSLLFQKQAGTIGYGLTLDLEFDKNIKSASPPEETKYWGDNKYNLTTDLSIDREFNIKF